MVEGYEFKRLQAILDGDGSEIREQLIYAGLLLTVFERFKEYIVGQVDGFFSNHVEIKDGKLHHKRGEKFKQIMKERGTGSQSQHANKAFRAALHWFFELDAISREEFDGIERIYLLRNDIGHELFRIIVDDQTAPIALEDVLFTISVYLKIVRWWVKEVEAATDPDFGQRMYDNANWDEVESTDTVFLREIIRKALLSDMTWEQIEELARSEQAEPGEQQ